MRNKILLISLIVIIATGLTITGISAYFMALDAQNNEADIGNNEIALHETFVNPEIKPGEITTITKRVEVENTGLNYSAVRVRVEFSDSNLLVENGGTASVDYNAGTGPTQWTKVGDYWYYNSPLDVRETTVPLFSKVTITNPTADQVKDFDVYVYAESRDCAPNDTISSIPALFDKEAGQ